MRRWVIVAELACVAALVLGCSGHVVELGTSGDGGGGGGGDDGGSSGVNPLSGTYKGYIESFKFPDGSDTVIMSLTFADDGKVTGTVFFGDSPALAPPTDPNLGYPPGYTGLPDPGRSTLESFAFTVLGAIYASPRVTLGFDANELWKAWCGTQTTIYPKYNGESDGGCGPLIGYGCLPDIGYGQGTGGCTWYSCDQPANTPVDCGKLALCGGQGPNPCTCTATSCTVSAPVTPGITFDMQLVSGALDGSEQGIGGSALNVHLVKQP
jgi:hypothetical protein